MPIRFAGKRISSQPTQVQLVQSMFVLCSEAYYYYYYACVPGQSLHAQNGSLD